MKSLTLTGGLIRLWFVCGSTVPVLLVRALGNEGTPQGRVFLIVAPSQATQPSWTPLVPRPPYLLNHCCQTNNARLLCTLRL